MSLLREIQASICDGKELGPILLKLQLLASRLGSDFLEDWVKHESEGYPQGIEVPNYRKTSVTYRGTFLGPFGSGIKNAQIPGFLIEEIAGPGWTTWEIRESIAAIDDLMASADDGNLQLSASSNLMLLLEGKIYEGYSCNSVTGKISKSALASIQHSLRSRILELTVELEEKIPDAADVTLGAPNITVAF